MRKMTKDQFYDVITTYISQVAKTVDLSDKDTVIFTPEFDDLIRHIQSKPSAKLKLVYVRETAEVKLLYRQLDSLLQKSDEVRIL